MSIENTDKYPNFSFLFGFLSIILMICLDYLNIREKPTELSAGKYPFIYFVGI